MHVNFFCNILLLLFLNFIYCYWFVWFVGVGFFLVCVWGGGGGGGHFCSFFCWGFFLGGRGVQFIELTD